MTTPLFIVFVVLTLMVVVVTATATFTFTVESLLEIRRDWLFTGYLVLLDLFLVTTLWAIVLEV